ncbi:MAG: alternative ribosome rescue aminoacyl-tRNA hydrolase ArfB [Planctomycetaceae bacterium]
MLTVNAQISIPLAEFHFSFSRSSGPGGQNVNKVNTKVTLRWDISNSPSLPDAVRDRFCSRFHRRLTKSGTFLMYSQRFRDQGRNVADCLAKLRALLLEVSAPVKVRRKSRPSRGSIERRLGDKRRLAEKKQRRRRPTRDD